MPYRWAADIVVTLHFAFILFVIFGGLLAWRWRWIAWLHLPALAYGLLIEIFNWYCPLTILELRFRREAGFSLYEGSFISEYLNRLIYLDVSRGALIAAALLVCAANVVIYTRMRRPASAVPADR